jgi:hypothetical protein
VSSETRAPHRQREDAAVVAWRAERLVAAGFDGGAAAGIAANPAFDVHALLELTDRGCPPELAARIVHPLD